PRVVAGGAGLVEGLEAVEPEGSPGARAHADLDGEDLGRELASLVELHEEGPEFSHRVADRALVVGIGAAAGQGGLEAAARQALPRCKKGGLNRRPALPPSGAKPPSTIRPVAPPPSAARRARPPASSSRQRAVPACLRSMASSARGKRSPCLFTARRTVTAS